MTGSGACLKAIFAAGLWLMPMAAHSEALVFSKDGTEACLQESQGDSESCIGASSENCMIDTPGGSSTVVMLGCFDAELSYWDARLNTAYQQRLKELRLEDAENLPGVPSSAEALKDMQRAWIRFRDAQCAYARSLWGGGTGGGPAAVACLMRATAVQTLYLEEVVR